MIDYADDCTCVCVCVCVCVCTQELVEGKSSLEQLEKRYAAILEQKMESDKKVVSLGKNFNMERKHREEIEVQKSEIESTCTSHIQN